MSKLVELFNEVNNLTSTNIKGLVAERLDLVLLNYINELEASKNNILKQNSKYDIFKELSKNKWMRR